MLLPRSLGFNIVSSRSTCFSAVVFSVTGFAGHRSLNATLIALKDALLPVVRVCSHASAGDFVFMESLKYLTLSASDRPDFMRIVLSILFMKSWGSWSSGLPVKNVAAVSVISSSSRLVSGFTDYEFYL